MLERVHKPRTTMVLSCFWTAGLGPGQKVCVPKVYYEPTYNNYRHDVLQKLKMAWSWKTAPVENVRLYSGKLEIRPWPRRERRGKPKTSTETGECDSEEIGVRFIPCSLHSNFLSLSFPYSTPSSANGRKFVRTKHRTDGVVTGLPENGYILRLLDH